MPEPSEDLDLLRQYVADKSEPAFAELVRRHLDLVYSVALRQVGGDTHLAEDVAQVVFTTLARKAGRLAGRPVLAGWLYRTTQYAAVDAVRAEARRRAREQKAQTMTELAPEPNRDAEWEKLRPLLENAIGELNDDDRDAVVLRFFNGCSFAEVGRRLRLTENTARMRVQRALDKLHAGLTRHGCTSTAAALGLALANSAGGAAPAGLAATITGAALGGASVGGVAAAWTTFMTVSKLQIGIAAAVAAAGVGGYVIQEQTNAALRSELAVLRREAAALGSARQEVGELRSAAAEAAELRQDDAEFDRLAEEANQLKARLQAQAKARALKNQQAAPLWTAGQPVFDLNQLSQKPTPTFQARPEYPLSLRRLGIGGDAVVSFVVDVNGQVRDAYSTRATHPALAEAAVQAIEKWKFRPGQKDARTVNTRLMIPIVFSINKGDQPHPTFPEWF